MDRKVLLIGDTKSFMFNAIVTGLERESYSVVTSATNVNAISHIENAPKIWVMYLDSNVEEQSEALVFIKDTIVEQELYFFVVGNHDEITSLKKVMPEEIIKGELQRPLNVKDLAAALDHAVEEGEETEAKKRILVVDDDPAMTRTIKNLLSGRYQVYMASSGMNAITFLAKTPVDLILLDYEMPVISGAKVLEMIRSEVSTSDIPVMFLTGKSDKNTVMEVLSLKPEKYLLKTLPPQELIANIDEFFEKQKIMGLQM